eukprot:TRINITY_DN18053_c1_g1_i3.p1 TRINITY_DN18053_c1_g1~~TRINITY_DN18053_c1_g1_i3.p1  ORF type:complete len:278 (+),score=21.57 TRINITY_DN18053_c1_g1_i3:64-834(+)
MAVVSCIEHVCDLISAGRCCRLTLSSPSPARRKFRFVVNTGITHEVCRATLAVIQSLQVEISSKVCWAHSHQHSNGVVTVDIYIQVSSSMPAASCSSPASPLQEESSAAAAIPAGDKARPAKRVRFAVKTRDDHSWRGDTAIASASTGVGAAAPGVRLSDVSAEISKYIRCFGDMKQFASNDYPALVESVKEQIASIVRDRDTRLAAYHDQLNDMRETISALTSKANISDRQPDGVACLATPVSSVTEHDKSADPG